MPAPIRFWGTILAARPRLVLTKFDGETEVACPGYIATVDGTLTEGLAPATGKTFTVVIGATTFQNRELAVGDLVRGDAHPVPEGLWEMDTPADLYKVGTLHVIQRGYALPAPNPPVTDPALSPDATCTVPRRPLALHKMQPESACHHCGYAVNACVVRVSDPRDYRRGRWMQVPACLGPEDCPHFELREG